MHYSIVATDHSSSLENRKKSRAAHVERLKELIDAGRLLVAGPNPSIDNQDPGPAGFSGSLIVAEFESLEAANEWASQDPYVEAGVYQHIEVKPFNPVLP